ESCKAKIEWSLSHHKLIFGLPFSECLVETSIPDLEKVYYPSSFVLPLPTDDIQSNFNKLDSKFKKLNIISSSIATLDKEFDEIERIKQKLKLSDFRSIEIIGVFTAIAAFVLSQVGS